MRSLWLTDSCKDSQVHALNPIERTPQSWLQVERGKLAKMSCSDPSSFYNSSLIKLAEPPIEPNFKPLDYVEVLAQIHEELEASPNLGKSDLYLLQSQVFRGLGEVKLLRRSLQSAWKHASTVHEKLVYAAWLKHEKQGEEMISDLLSQCSKCLQEFTPLDIISEFSPKAASIDFSCSPISKNQEALLQCGSASDPSSDIVVFHIGEDEIVCNRQKVATMSAPFHAMLNGCFTEARKRDIDFSDNGISARGMCAICKFSETGKLSDDLSPDVLLDILAFANKFCCEQLKDACDRNLASLIHTEQDAITFMEYGLEEGSQVLVASCLQVILRELPYSLQHEQVAKLFYNTDMRKRSIMAGSASFALYSLLSDVAMKDDLKSDKSAFFLECLRECATTSRQKSLAVHQLGCVMLARREYDKAERLFDAAVNEGHVYSHAGLARAKYKRGYKHAAYDEISTLLSSCKQLGWMYQERSLYCDGKEKWLDLERATALDPTLTYPFMYRAAVLMREQSAHAALIEINRVLSFKLTLDCLELRTCFYLALQDYRGALSDIQAILTLNPNYMMYGGRVGASQLRSLLIPHVEHWTTADCWMQLYDRWSSVDDIGSLAVIYQMLESDSGKSLLFFRQSLLLLRLNCPEAAMHSLQLARQHATCEHERLVYEGWILYDTGHCEEGLRKAEESIAIQRSFEAFFLKAYALADSSIDPASSVVIVSLLAEALKCPSDGLRKGQALNNLGSVYVDCGKLDLAADCYVNALKIRHTRAHQGLARVYYLKNDKTAAYEEMTKLIEKARNKASAYEKRSEYCDREMTMADLQMVTELDPLRVYPYRYRAAVLMDSHQEDEAIAELSRAIAFKADLHLLHLRAAFHECIGDVAGALRDCRAALSVDPNHQEIMELHSRVHSQEP